MKRKSLIFLVFLAAGFGIYGGSLKGDFVLDDFDLVAENALVAKPDLGLIFSSDLFAGSAQGGRRQYYRPMQTVSYALDRALWGPAPFGPRVTNVLIHVLNAFLLFLLLSELFGKNLPAFAAALLFEVSPLHSGAVAYVSGRADPLGFLFLAASLLCVVRFARGKGPAFYAAALALSLGAFFSRENTLLLPLFVFLTAFAAGTAPRRALFLSFGFVPGALVYGAARAWALSGGVPAPGSDSPVAPLAAAGRLLVLALAPADLHPMRTFSPGPAAAAWAAGFLVFVAGLAFLFRRRDDRAGRFALAWTVLGLAPLPLLVNFFGTERITIAEHWFYLASAGFFALPAFAFGCGRRRAIALCVLAAAYAPLAWGAARVWTGDEALYGAILRHEPWNTKARFNLADYYRAEKRFDEAERELAAVSRAEPGSWDVETEWGHLKFDRGDRAGARVHYERALELYPGSAQAMAGMGQLTDDPAKAMDYFRTAFETRPGDPSIRALFSDALARHGVELGRAGRYAESADLLEKALKVDPASLFALQNLGATYANAGRDDEAARVWRKALEREPGDAATRENLRKLEERNATRA